jgi:hypothetical protein
MDAILNFEDALRQLSLAVRERFATREEQRAFCLDRLTLVIRLGVCEARLRCIVTLGLEARDTSLTLGKLLQNDRKSCAGLCIVKMDESVTLVHLHPIIDKYARDDAAFLMLHLLGALFEAIMIPGVACPMAPMATMTLRQG